MSASELFQNIQSSDDTTHFASFAIDSQENLYLAAFNKAGSLLAYGDLLQLPRGGSEFRSLIQGGALFGTPVNVIIDIHVKQLDSEDLRRAFGLSPPKPALNSLANPLPPSYQSVSSAHATEPMECMWILDFKPRGKLMLLHLQLQKVITVAGVEDECPSRDGYAVIAPVSSSGEARPLATFYDAYSLTQINRLVVIYETNPYGDDDGTGSFRLLDLDSWKVTTIRVERPSTPFVPRLFPWPKNPLSGSSDPRDDVILLVNLSDFGVCYINLFSGEIIQGGCDPSLEDERYARIPIVSSASSPIYLYFEPDCASVQKTFSGKYLPHFSLPRRAFAAHIASSGQLITADNESFRYYRVQAAPPAGARLPCFDFSELINNVSISPQHRFQVDHPASKSSWNVPSDLLTELHPSLNLERLKIVLKVSPLPPASIEAFILFLHHKHPHTVDWIQRCRFWSHIIYLWREIGLTSNDAISTFASTIVPQLPVEESCAALIDIWNDTQTNWTSHDPVIQFLTSHVVKHCFQEFAMLVTLQLTDRNILLALNVTEFEKTSGPLPIASCVNQGLKVVALEWETLPFPPTPKSLLVRPTDFVFSLGQPNDQSIAVVADSRYMYLRWGYFKRLMETGNGIEKTTRTAVMPDFMSSDMLMAILECIHGHMVTLLGEEDALTLLEHRLEFDLVDSKGVPFPPFQQLIERCMEASFPDIDDENCISCLERYHRLQMPAKVDVVLNYIVASNPQLRANTLLYLPIELLLRLQHISHERREIERL